MSVGTTAITISDTLDLAWELLEPFGKAELKRIRLDTIARHREPVGPAPA